jgi:hypothetical protein
MTKDVLLCTSPCAGKTSRCKVVSLSYLQMVQTTLLLRTKMGGDCLEIMECEGTDSLGETLGEMIAHS